MKGEKTHVYFMPGMAANPSIFKNILLSKEKFHCHLLEWFVPDKGMSLQEYAKEMSKKIMHDNPVLIGVSFGGILVQEMDRFINTRKLIIVSSVKSEKELPKKMKLARLTKVYKLLPTGLVNNVEFVAKYAFGEKVNKRLKLYEEYLSIRDKRYMDWALDNMVNWKQSRALEDVVHIHGDKDPVFPIKNIKDCIKVSNGTHTMIIHRAKWFNERLPAIILE